jgi:hypothetical protein
MTIEVLPIETARPPVRRSFAEIFTNTAQVCSQPATAADKNVQSNRALANVTKPCDKKTAPSPLHQPVNPLHSIEKSTHTIPRFLLTLKIKGVKT